MELHTRQSLLDIHGIDVPPRRRTRPLSTIIQLVRRLWQTRRSRSGRADIHLVRHVGIEPRDPKHGASDRRLATSHDNLGRLS